MYFQCIFLFLWPSFFFLSEKWVDKKKCKDKNGMMVSWIQSNYNGFGSGLVDENLGFAFQDRGALFSLQPDSPNVYNVGMQKKM